LIRGPFSEADRAIERFKTKLPKLYHGHTQAFCAVVIRAVKENPAAFTAAA